MKFATVPEAIKEVQRGKYLIVVDDEHRENEGDLMIAAELATPQKLSYMIKHGGGLMCVPISGEILDKLKIPMMIPDSTDKFHTPFSISVDAANNTTTGMSVADRCETIKTLISESSKPEDLCRPGHIFPLRAAANGVLDRPGHTESAVDLCKLAGLKPVAVIIEVMNEDGSMAKLPELEKLAKENGLLILKIADLVEHIKKK